MGKHPEDRLDRPGSSQEPLLWFHTQGQSLVSFESFYTIFALWLEENGLLASQGCTEAKPWVGRVIGRGHFRPLGSSRGPGAWAKGLQKQRSLASRQRQNKGPLPGSASTVLASPRHCLYTGELDCLFSCGRDEAHGHTSQVLHH